MAVLPRRFLAVDRERFFTFSYMLGILRVALMAYVLLLFIISSVLKLVWCIINLWEVYGA